MQKLTSLFKALSEEKRLRIIKLLEGGELCVCDIVAALNMSQPKVSFHLNILKEAGLIKDRKDGRWIYYRIDDSDMLRRFLLLTVMERIFEGAVSKDSKRLGAFMKNKAKKGSAAACKSCREDIDNG
ncbi:MAG: ArsR family transcriptional regulator [Nitrospirae bacterium]|nr:MAG: ArsR family transcriptional regulator [Nitrospirota bacterium]